MVCDIQLVSVLLLLLVTAPDTAFGRRSLVHSKVEVESVSNSAIGTNVAHSASGLDSVVVSSSAHGTPMKDKPAIPPPPFSPESNLCYATKEHLEYYHCGAGQSGEKAAMDDLTERPRASKPMVIPSEVELGFEELSGNESYIVVLEKAKSAGEQMFNLLLGATRDVATIAASTLVPYGGTLYSWIRTSMTALFGQDDDKQLDLGPYFARFEEHLNKVKFKATLDEIKTKYEVFLAWFQDVQVTGSQTLDARLLERGLGRVEMIDMQLDLAGTMFTRNAEIDPGMAAYYLLEPLFNHAFLHAQVIFLRAAYLCSLDDIALAKQQLDRALTKHKFYKKHLSSMRSEALAWRLSFVKAHNKPLSASALCRPSHRISGVTYRKDVWQATYQWADTFYKSEKYTRREALQVEKMQSYTTFHIGCYLQGEPVFEEFTDGRQMLQEATQYRDDLQVVVNASMEKVLTTYDAVWSKVPRCIPGFDLVLDAQVDESCWTAATEMDIKDHFGPLAERPSDDWPAGTPVRDPRRYLACPKTVSSLLQRSPLAKPSKQFTGEACIQTSAAAATATTTATTTASVTASGRGSHSPSLSSLLPSIPIMLLQCC